MLEHVNPEELTPDEDWYTVKIVSIWDHAKLSTLFYDIEFWWIEAI